MLEFEAFPSWVREGSTVEDGYLRFNSFARAKFFLEEEQLRPFADFEFFKPLLIRSPRVRKA